MIPAVLWAFCLLFWFGCGVRCLLFLSSLFFLSATYLTEPGLIPKGAPLTPEQNRLLASASCTSHFLPSLPAQRLLRQVFICIKDGDYNRLEVRLLSRRDL